MKTQAEFCGDRQQQAKRRAILMIQGFMGSPRQFHSLISRLDPLDGDIFLLTLPGHESSLREFTQNGRKQWLEFTLAFVQEMQANYDELILVGHSAGGLLAIQAAVREPRTIRAIVAIALPLSVRLTMFGLHTWIRSVGRPRHHDPAALTAARRFCGVSGITLFNSFRLLPNTFELLKLIKETRPYLTRLTSKLIVMTSLKDEIVSGRSFRLLKHLRPQTTLIELQTARHFWYPDQDLDLIARQIRFGPS